MSEQGFLGIFPIPFRCLIDPSYDFRVRDVNKNVVSKLCKLMSSEQCPLSTFLVKLVHDNEQEVPNPFTESDVLKFRYMVIDGNHRYSAMKLLNYSDDVHCYVYNCISPLQAIGLGYQRNIQDSNTYKMTDLEKIRIIRKAFDREKAKRVAYQAVYDVLNVTDVSIILYHTFHM